MTGPLLLAAAALPDLLPPRELVPPGFWEQHGGRVVGGAVLVLIALAAAALWWWRRPRPAVVAAPPATVARTALDRLRGRAADAALVAEVSHLVRRYVLARLKIERTEPTTEELARVLAAHGRVTPETAAAITGFLRDCDLQKFAPASPEPERRAPARPEDRQAHPPVETVPGAPGAPVERALELIERVEASLQPAPPPLAPPAAAPRAPSAA